MTALRKLNYRKEARGRECQIRIPGVCNRDNETTVLCHLPGGGMGMKRDDIHGAWGCSACHAVVDGAPSEFDTATLKLWHYEGVFRTQSILRAEGKL